MKKIILSFLLVITGIVSKAQFVTIPDANFVTYLQTNYPSCMVGNQMDTTCIGITSEDTLAVGNMNISDLTGMDHFTNLLNLDCNSNQLTVLPALPNSLVTLWCGYNQLTSLPALPNSLVDLNCDGNQLTVLPNLPNTLVVLFFDYNQLTVLPVLPNSLLTLGCGGNLITSLPGLPNSLEYLYCYNSQLTTLPALPNSLLILDCQGNLLTTLPALPNSLLNLDCNFNLITSLPTLPNTLEFFNCSYNQLTTLPALPSSLLGLYCEENLLTTLPALPNFLEELFCNDNQLITLPALPNSLLSLECGTNLISSLPALPTSLEYLYSPNNHLTTLPPLSNSITYLYCNHNFLTTLPPLPTSLYYLFCDTNNISCFPVFPSTLVNSFFFNISGNPFTCLPNYVPAMNAATLAYPICGNNPTTPTISTGDTTICLGSSTTLSIASGSLNGALDWQWYTGSCGGFLIGNGISISVSPTITTTYYVRGEGGCIALGGCASFTVSVTSLPDITTTLTTTTISSNQNGASYQWLDCNNGNSPITGATNQSYTSLLNGSFAVLVSMNGCSDTSACIQINGSGINDASSSPRLITILPNPNTGKFMISVHTEWPEWNNSQSRNDREFIIEMYNVLGEKVYADQPSFSLAENPERKLLIDISNQPAGVFFLKFKNGKEKIVKKVVKLH